MSILTAVAIIAAAWAAINLVGVIIGATLAIRSCR